MTSRLLILALAARWRWPRPGCAAAMAQTSPVAVAKGYKAPRNAFGQPDMSGVWSNATITRLERDPKYGERLILTPDEAKAIEGASDQRNARLRANTDTSIKDPDKLPECQSGAQGAACGYNAFWTDPGTRLVRIGGEARTSILTAPANGRLPGRPAAAGRRPSGPRPARRQFRQSGEPRARRALHRGLRRHLGPADDAGALQQPL